MLVVIFTVRLIGGLNSREGRLELLHNGIWGGVCYDSGYTRAVNDAGARVVCSELGFGYACMRY